MDGLVTVIGGSGFVGRYVVQALCRTGVRVRVVCRRPRQALFLKPLGNLGQVQIAGGDVRHEDRLAALLAGSTAVINLVGILNGDFDAVQAKGAGAVARAARAAGARALVHVSAIGADRDSESRYGRSKGEGEALVRAAFPEATIMRPSVIFGPEDNFTNRFAAMARLAPVMPVVAGDTRFQPVWVGDVAEAIVAAVSSPDKYGGQLFSLGGPRVYTFRELIAAILDEAGARRTLVDVPAALARPMARIGSFLPGAPITWDQWLMLQTDNVVPAGTAGLEALGVAPTPLEAKAPNWLVQYRKQGRFTRRNANAA